MYLGGTGRKENPMFDVYLAHKDEAYGGEQLLLDHLLGTAKSAKEYASAFGAGEQAYYCRLLHDIGKYEQQFNKRDL
jgi:CRISPR-associated endonuclease/helicase Cas3